jgi:hypothetical protein
MTQVINLTRPTRHREGKMHQKRPLGFIGKFSYVWEFRALSEALTQGYSGPRDKPVES